MTKDLTINIDNSILNIRAGCILNYKDNFLLEYGDNTNHQTIPGGRIKLLESSKETIIRELKEELDFNINKTKITKNTVLENFFKIDNKSVHEIYFIHEYKLTKQEYEKLKQVKRNQDSNNSSYKFIKKEEIQNTNILPIELKEIIEN